MVSFTDHYNAISIGWLPSKAIIGKGSWCFSTSPLCKPEFSSALKRILIYYLKTPPLQKSFYNFKTEFFFFFKEKHKKTTTIQQVTGGKKLNLVLKRMLELFVKLPPLKKILEFQDWKKTPKLMQKKLQTRNQAID